MSGGQEQTSAVSTTEAIDPGQNLRHLISECDDHMPCITVRSDVYGTTLYNKVDLIRTSPVGVTWMDGFVRVFVFFFSYDLVVFFSFFFLFLLYSILFIYSFVVFCGCVEVKVSILISV